MPVVEEIVEELTSSPFGQRQILMFSATFSQNIQHLGEQFLRNGIVVNLICNECADSTVKCFSCEPIFKYKSFKDAAHSAIQQSNLVHTFWLKLESKFTPAQGVIVNGDIALLKNCIRYKKLTKRHSIQNRDKHDVSRIDCTVSTGYSQIEHFFAHNHTATLIVNVSNLEHTSALIIEKNGNDYKYTAFNPNHGYIMQNTQILCAKINPPNSTTRTIRCIIQDKNNTLWFCFAYTWRFIYRCFLRLHKVDDFPTDFIYDFVAKKRLTT